jgi:hypothetical protein
VKIHSLFDGHEYNDIPFCVYVLGARYFVIITVQFRNIDHLYSLFKLCTQVFSYSNSAEPERTTQPITEISRL